MRHHRPRPVIFGTRKTCSEGEGPAILRDRASRLRSRLTFALLLAGLVCGQAAAQSTRPTWRVSVDSTGAESNFSNLRPSISGDGRFVAFLSSANNLVPGDTNSRMDVFVHDTTTGTTRRVSIDSNGAESDWRSWSPSISADGRFVAFQSFATNLVPGDNNRMPDIFLHDTTTGTTSRVSVSSAGAESDGYSQFPSISASGRFVAFTSIAADLVLGDNNGSLDVFVHDTVTGTTSRVSVDSNGAEGDWHSSRASMSADGRFVTFLSKASNLVSGDTNGFSDVFVHDRATGATSRVSVDSSGLEGNRSSFDPTGPTISADGRFVAFFSNSTNLVPADNNGAGDIFVHDRATGTTSRASVDSAGAEANWYSSKASISADGRFVAFLSLATNLVPGDTNERTDAFVHDRATGATTRVSVDSVGSQSNNKTYHPMISSNGRFVAVASDATNLVPGDTNGYRDVFVRDRLALSFQGVPQSGSPVSFALSNAFGEAGHAALVLLSCSGTSPTPLPLTDWPVYLTFDACTSIGLSAGPLLQATVQADGTAQTPQVPFPAVGPGLTVHAAAVTIGGSQFVAGTSPISFVTQ